MGFLTTPLFSAGAKLRLLKEPFIGRAPEEETIAQFVRRRLGEELLQYAVGPFVSGVYAGDPEKLSVRHATAKIYALEEKHGSLIRGAIAKRKGPAPAGGLFSFPEGLGYLPETLAGVLGEGYAPETSVLSVERARAATASARDSATAMRGRSRPGPSSAPCPRRRPARPSRPSAGSSPRASRRFPTPTWRCVCMGFRRDQVAHPLDGFGFLAPEVEGRHVLGCLFTSLPLPGPRARGPRRPLGLRGRRHARRSRGGAGGGDRPADRAGPHAPPGHRGRARS